MNLYSLNFICPSPPKKITYLGTRRGLIGTCFLCTECITYLQILTLERGSTWYSRIRMVWTNGESRTCLDSRLNTFLSRVCVTRNPGSVMTLQQLVTGFFFLVKSSKSGGRVILSEISLIWEKNTSVLDSSSKLWNRLLKIEKFSCSYTCVLFPVPGRNTQSVKL